MSEARFTVFKEQDFSAAHFLREYHGGCERLHGHNYRVRLYASCDELDSAGLVVDFAELKAIMQRILGRFDHQLLNEVPPFDAAAPSLELLAQHIAEEAAREIDNARVRISKCQVWETDRNCAIYRR
jgi:6-pyruvoyltetrahydropterin/6-carboxytetrahydropterin synthase